MEYHTPVLLQEVIELLHVQPGQVYIDGTLGNGGHALEILRLGGIVYGIDSDPQNLAIATSRIKTAGFSETFHPIKGNFHNVVALVSPAVSRPVSGLLLDLGLSSNQQKSPDRGFSFNDRQSLDMRLDKETQTLTAEEIINTYSYTELFDIFSKIAQETLSKPLVQNIINARQRKPIKTGDTLANIIRELYQKKGNRPKTDPSTKIFLALRIVVNSEFDNLKKILEITTTDPIFRQSIVCIISFHSGEDRIVKQFIRNNSPNQLIDLAPKIIVPARSEITQNPLSRSAVLRSYKIV